MSKDPFDELAQIIAAGFAEVNKRLEDLDRKQHERFTSVELRLGHVENRLGRLEDLLEKEQAFTSDLRDEHERRITTLEAKLSPKVNPAVVDAAVTRNVLSPTPG